jgi:hypothetical protein
MRLQARFAIVVWMLAACTQLLAPGNAAEPNEAVPKAAVRESFRFDPDDRLVLIPVRVGSKDYQFMLDTGTTGSVFDVSLRSHLGPCVDSVRARSAKGDDVELELYSPPDARVGSLPLAKEPVACHDFTPFREASGCNVRGIVGMDFLKDWIITIDFDRGRFDILPPGTQRDPKWGERMRFEYGTEGEMLVLATVGGNTLVAFTVDTGNAGTGNLEGAFITRLVGAHEARVTGDEKAVTVSGIRSAGAARLSHFSLGSFRHENLRFMGGKQNVLGLNYLSRYRVTIDFPNQRLYLAKGKRFADHDRGSTSGLFCFFRAGGLEIESADEKGPAHAAGLRAKDVIVKVCGKPISEWKPSEIYRRLAVEGKAVQVTVQRGGKQMEMSFTPKEYD